jgi:hypothetical protein
MLNISSQISPQNSDTCVTTTTNNNNNNNDNTISIIKQDSNLIECTGCGCLITEKFYLNVMNKQWHIECLRCVDCKLCLHTQNSCFTKDGYIYCKDDYLRYVCIF